MAMLNNQMVISKKTNQPICSSLIFHESPFLQVTRHSGISLVKFQDIIYSLPGWWFQTFFIFHNGIILPIDFHIFQDCDFTTN